MFDFKQANEWMKASNLGRWEVYPRADGKEAAEELQQVANKQKRGKKHFNVKKAANVRSKNDTYVFIGADGTPAVYVLAFWNSDRVSLDDILGCETSGAVEPRYITAVKALTQSDVNFKLKVEDSAKAKIKTGDALKPEEKVFVQTFLPPSEGYEVKAGLIGGGTGFMSSRSQNRNAWLSKTATAETNAQEAQQGQKQKPKKDPNDLKKLTDDQPDTDMQNPEDANYYAQIFQQLALITIIKENLVMNSSQILQILESIESGLAVENENGELISVTHAMTMQQFDQIEEFLDHPENAQCGIKRGKKYIKLRDKIRTQHQQQQEAEAKKNVQTKREQQKGTEAAQKNDFQDFEKELEDRLEKEVLDEPQQSPSKTRGTRLKKFTDRNKRFKIKDGQIRTKQH